MYDAYGLQAFKLIKQIGKKIQKATSEKLSAFYLMQSILMAIQQGNAVCVRGSPVKTLTCLEDTLQSLTGPELIEVNT